MIALGYDRLFFTVKSYARRPWLDVMADTGIGDGDHRQRLFPHGLKCPRETGNLEVGGVQRFSVAGKEFESERGFYRRARKARAKESA
jgi:hypothetical protein